MDKDRVAGTAKQAKGSLKDLAGKMMGDTKMQAEGKTEKAEGKVQNAVGGLKDKLRETAKKH
jgi:uncharacterized protein YjbJ (UPF0337 family)